MSYTDIDRPSDYFRVKTYSGSSSDGNAITWDETDNNMRPDWLWLKNRTASQEHWLANSVRGTGKFLESNSTNTESSDGASGLASFDTNGFTLNDSARTNRNTMVGWGWSAGGTAPAITYVVKVVSDSGNKYRFDDFGTSAVTLDLQEGGTYTFDQSDSSNSGHPLRFSTTSNGTHGGGSEYTTGVTVTGTPGNSGAKTVITVAASAPTLYYYCTQHSAMGGQANTNSTFGSSNFSGSIQSTVSAGTTQGLSIVKYVGTGSAGATVGHKINTPRMIIIKGLTFADVWIVGGDNLGGWNKELYLNSTDVMSTNNNAFNGVAPTSSVFTLGSGNGTNKSGESYVAFCMEEKKGYSKFGSYTGNSNADGTFVYTGFKPAFFMVKATNATENWLMVDNKRTNSFNPIDGRLIPNSSGAEETNVTPCDFVSNGVKFRLSDGAWNSSSNTYIYMAFSESSFVTSTGIPTTAR